MFGLFGKRKHYERLDDAVWMTAAARQAGVVSMAQQAAAGGQATLICCPTLSSFKTYRDSLGAQSTNPRAIEAYQVNPSSVRPLAANGRLRVMVPELQARLADEEKFLAALDVPDVKVQVQFHASLDDPLLRPMIPDTLINLLQTLGMKPDEPIVNPMVSKAIANARRKAQAR